MTSTPTTAGMPGEFFAKSANKSDGMPSEETIARAIYEAHGYAYSGRTVLANGHPYSAWAKATEAARDILSLIRLAFEAKDAEIERLNDRSRDIWDELIDLKAIEQGMREKYIAAEAKLAQAVESNLSLCEQLTKAEAELTMTGGAKSITFDGKLVICHPDIPPHMWDGERMIRIEPGLALAEGEEG